MYYRPDKLPNEALENYLLALASFSKKMLTY